MNHYGSPSARLIMLYYVTLMCRYRIQTIELPSSGKLTNINFEKK